MYHSKVTLSLTPIQRLGNQARNCKMDHSNLYFYFQLGVHQPDEMKYIFEVQHVNKDSDFMSIKSKYTGRYLASDEDGKAFVEEVVPSLMKDDQPTDRQTWFLLHFVETVKRERESTLYSCNFESTSIDYSVTCQAQVEAC